MPDVSPKGVLAPESAQRFRSGNSKSASRLYALSGIRVCVRADTAPLSGNPVMEAGSEYGRLGDRYTRRF
jgi:hypothetical protein